MALVTGANGFLGARLVRHLVEQGEHVKALVRAGGDLQQLRDLPTEQVTLAFGDVRVSSSVYAALAGCDRLYHTAAVNRLWDRKPERIVQTAVLGTAEVLEAARRRGLERVVVTSTIGTIGPNSKPEPLTEEDSFKLSDTVAYVTAKVEAERLALQRAAEGLPVVVVNPGSLFGPGDWKPTPGGRMLLDALKMPFLFYPETGGISVTDVDDVARGHRLAMESGRVGERYILAGDNLRHKDLFELVADLAGMDKRLYAAKLGTTVLVGRLMDFFARLEYREPVFDHRLARDHMFAYVWGSSEKAQKELGYTFRPARQALLRSLRWYLEHGYVAERTARDVALARA
jgi:dihydroflavonol-4-reductase